MNKQETIKLIKSQEWAKCCGPLNFMNCYGFAIGFIRMSKYYKEYYDVILVSASGNLGCQHGSKEQNLKNIKQLYDDPKTTRDLIKKWMILLDDFYQKSEEYTKALEKLDDNQLNQKFNEFIDLLCEMWAIPLAIDAGGIYTEGILLDKFAEHIKEDTASDYVRVCQPSEISFMSEEHISLLNLAKLYKNNDPSFDAELENHQKKYFWIENNYRDIKVLDKTYFLKKIKQELDKDFDKEIEKIMKKPEKQDILEKLPKSLKDEILLVGEIGAWNDTRKAFNFRSNHYLSLFLKEFSKRLNIDLEDLYYATPEETISGNINNEIIEKRKKNFVFVVEQPEIQTMYEGEDAVEIQKVLKEQYEKFESEEIKGTVASKTDQTIVKGTARIVMNPSTDEFHEGDIIVASMTRPEYVPIMRKAKAIITDEGGITSHASIVSRELGIPCIIGAKNATKILNSGDKIELNTDNGIVIKND